VRHLRHPQPLRDPFWNCVVLGAAMVFEGASFPLAWREFREQARDRPLWKALRMSKDLTTYTVVAEDAAALASLIIAADRHRVCAHARPAGARRHCLPADRAAGARGSRAAGGEGVQPATAAEIQALARRHDDVLATGPVRSMYLGPTEPC
jgi:hypothetical protein